MRIYLDFVEEDEGVRPALESVSGIHTQIKIKIVDSLCILEEFVIQRILEKIDFDVIVEELRSRFPDDI